MVKVLDDESINRIVKRGNSTRTGSGSSGGGGTGINMSDVWAAMTGQTDEQINGSHLTTALTGYATQTWVSSKISDMATKTWVSSQISDMATKTWSDGRFLKLTGGEVTGTLVLSKTQDASGTADNGPALVVGGTRTQAHLEMDANELMAKGSGTTTAKLYLNSEGGEVELGDNLVLRDGKRIYNSTGSGGSLYIGRSDDAGWVKMSDMCSRQGDTYWKITSNGNSEFANVYSRGYVTALSDERKKNIVSDIALTVEDIAKAPAVLFSWKDSEDHGIFAGSIAQYWQKVMPEVVQEQADGTLSLDYQVAALMASIVTARKVEEHDTLIRRMLIVFCPSVIVVLLLCLYFILCLFK